MSSTFLGLNTAYSGLQAAQASLNTTANNISNIETEGYSRQEVSTQAANAIRSFTTYGCVGAGVETLAIERVRDIFYDEKYWANQSKLGEYESKEYYMKTIEEYFTDNKTVKGFNTIFNEYYNTISELAKNPADNTVRQQSIGYAQNLTTYFNDMYTNLQKLQRDVNSEVKVNVDRINAIAEEVSALNKQINVIEMNSGAHANELRDQRDKLIDELSEICGVDVEERKVIDSNDPDRVTGGTRYIVKICGQTLVDDSTYKTLQYVPRENYERVYDSDIDGLYDIYFRGQADWTTEDYRTKGDMLNVYSPTTGGKLQGLIQMRDGCNGENFKGTVSAVDVGLQQVTVKVKADYLMDLTKCNLPSGGEVDQNGNYYTTGGTINIGSQRYYYSAWTYTMDENTGDCSYTFQLNQGLNGKHQVQQSAATKEQNVEIGTNLIYQGIPYYMSQMNEWVRSYSQAYNEILHAGVLDNGDEGRDLFTAYLANGDRLNEGETLGGTGDTKVALKGDGTSTIVVGSTDNSYVLMNAGNISIADELTKDPSLFATRRKQYSGDEDNTLVEDIIDLKTNQNRMSYRSCSADQFLVCVMSDVSLNTQRAKNFTQNYEVLGTGIQNQRLSVSGVDSEEEAINLNKFQQQYNLASKMIQTLSEVYDRLILQTGV
ncbi:MAG: flagellar hook-associated protein FlgK [Lachnospiraceae bacterium]|nr:flagellar hook-associated protein FlgK [Lachnospiraceae bacterium]